MSSIESASITALSRYIRAYGLRPCSSSCRLLRTGDTPEGESPREGGEGKPFKFCYKLRPWDPSTLSGRSFDEVVGHFMYTKDGLGGVDLFGH